MLSKKSRSAWGKTLFEATISTDQQELNLVSWATEQGWNGSSEAIITIDSDVYIWSDDTSIPALTTGNFPNGLTLRVNGYIIGKGGAGGNTDDFYVGQDGGPALSLNCDITLIGGPNGYIAGGGGGGAAGGKDEFNFTSEVSVAGGGGGAGGGAGGGNDNELGGAGGSVGQIGSNGNGNTALNGGKGGGAGGGGAGIIIEDQ